MSMKKLYAIITILVIFALGLGLTIGFAVWYTPTLEQEPCHYELRVSQLEQELIQRGHVHALEIWQRNNNLHELRNTLNDMRVDYQTLLTNQLLSGNAEIERTIASILQLSELINDIDRVLLGGGNNAV
jgi:hypothetical protein